MFKRGLSLYASNAMKSNRIQVSSVKYRRMEDRLKEFERKERELKEFKMNDDKFNKRLFFGIGFSIYSFVLYGLGYNSGYETIKKYP